MSYYQNAIREELARTGNIGIDPRHVEAYIRLEHSTLDGLSKKSFNYEISVSVLCIKEDGKVNAEKCARSFGL